ncbi:MAG: exodeoxyribonuclease VII large subunit [Cryobacterium sp.]|nr:exodeoxyribonuclease VII large subunit [Oligoflexia bacterium]
MDRDDLPLFKNLNSRDELARGGDPQSLPKHLSVTELTSKIKGVLEPSFQDIWLQGEVSNFRPAASGHLYFSLKDSGASISAALFGSAAKKRLAFDLKDGLQVLCRGKVSVYGPRGTYQFIIEQMEPLGAGALQIAFEQLKAKLAEEGLFDPIHKKSLPPFPKKVAVITSPTGAAIRDMVNVLRRRAPHLEILVVPAIVQGDEAPRQLIRGLEAVNRFNLADVIILARGGGSIEDLWGFNDENLARAIFASKIPVISAVGHEIDFTISDFVSDLRAPTPSAAAEIVSGHWADVSRQVLMASDRMRSMIARDLLNRRNLLGHLSARVISPLDKLREKMQRIDEWAMRMERMLHQIVERRKLAFGQVIGKLEALSPLKVLDRGYSIARNDDGKVLRSVSDAKPGESFSVVFADGKSKARFI